ncbi:MAG: cache domain-containing protein, partial [Nitrospiria bacterium]
MTIKKKLILSFLFSALIPMLFVEFLGGYHAKNALEMAQIEKLEAVADLKVEKIQAIYNGLKTDIQVAQQFFNIKTALPTLTRLRNDPNPPDYITAKKRLDDQLQTFQKVKGYIDIMLVDTDGMIVYVTNEKHAGKDLDSPLPDPDHKSFEEGKKGIYFSNIFSNKIEDLPYSMLISAPVKDSQGKIIGVIALEANMDAVFRMIQDQTGLGLTGETMIGRIVGETVQLLNPLRHDKDSTIKRNVVMGSERSIPLQKSALGQEGSGLAIDYRHEEVIAAWRFIPDFHWGMVAKVDKKEAFDSVIQLNRRVAIFGGILFIMVIYIAFNIAKSIAQPIMSLQKGTEIVGGGDLDFRVGTKARDEIGQLS